jgi:hypothetical protein
MAERVEESMSSDRAKDRSEYCGFLRLLSAKVFFKCSINMRRGLSGRCGKNK